MCKKVMFLVWLVCLLGLSPSAFSADLEVPWIPPPEGCYVVHGTEEYGRMDIEGCVIVPAGATLIINGESDLDGNGDDGEGGSQYAQIIVDGGTFIMNDRLNVGCDHDAYIIVDNGGTIIHTDSKITIPDNDGGVHRLIVIDGTVDAYAIDLDSRCERLASVQIGCSPLEGIISAYLVTANTDEGDDNRGDPDYWKDREPNCGGLYDYPEGACAGSTLMINEIEENVKEVYYILIGPKAWKPDPEDGETAVAAETCDMILRWNEGTCSGDGGFRNFVYFGDDSDCVHQQGPAPAAGWNIVPPFGCFLGEVYPDGSGRAQKNVGPLPLWTTYYWRIDQVCAIGGPVKGDIWSFTTGCELIGGDANLDCMVNFLDYAAVASTWMDEQFFPEGCTP